MCLRPEYRLDLSLIESISQLTPVTERHFSVSFCENKIDESEMKLHNAPSLFPSQTHDQEKSNFVVISFTLNNAAYHWNEETCGSPLTATQVAQFEPRSIKCSATRVALLYSNCSHLYNSANSILTTPSFRFSHCCTRLEVRDTSSSEPQVLCDDLLGQNWSE